MRPSKAVFSLHFSSAGKVPFLTSRAKICSRGALSWGWGRVQGHVSNHAGTVLGAKLSETSFLHFKTFNKQVGHCIFTQQFKTSHFNYFIVPLLRIAANLSTLVYSLYYQNFRVHEGFLTSQTSNHKIFVWYCFLCLLDLHGQKWEHGLLLLLSLSNTWREQLQTNKLQLED